jgi:preprotein translocase subunit SecD
MPTKRKDEPAVAEPKPSLTRWAILIVLAVVVVVVVVVPRVTYWLGTAGKAVVILEPREEGKLGSGTLSELVTVLRQRAEALDLERPFVRRKGDLVTVAFKPTEDFNEVVAVLTTRGNMDFRPVPADYASEKPRTTPAQVFLFGPNNQAVPAEQVLKGVDPIVKRDDLRRKSAVDKSPDTGQVMVRVYLEGTGEQALGAWFAAHPNSLLAVTFDDKAISVAPLTARVSQYVNISGVFDAKEADKIATCLKTDPLPVNVTAVEKRPS